MTPPPILLGSPRGALGYGDVIAPQMLVDKFGAPGPWALAPGGASAQVIEAHWDPLGRSPLGSWDLGKLPGITWDPLGSP